MDIPRDILKQSIRQRMIDILELEAKAHEQVSFGKFGLEFNKIKIAIVENIDSEDFNLLLALNFYEAWIDEHASEFEVIFGIHFDEWPEFARLLINVLEHNQPIDRNHQLAKFDPNVIASKKRFFQEKIKWSLGVFGLMLLVSFLAYFQASVSYRNAGYNDGLVTQKYKIIDDLRSEKKLPTCKEQDLPKSKSFISVKSSTIYLKKSEGPEAHFCIAE